ncbi:MAG: hypothetical protein LBI11_00410 [Streptococcaceae bacterium]|jgi:hypothetical protein|nr:hypothetical protein [Streptococcaceae bacterium]
MSLLKDMTWYIKRLAEESDDVKEKLARVQDEAFLAQKTGNDIQKKITEFQFSAQGNLDAMTNILKKYEKPRE